MVNETYGISDRNVNRELSGLIQRNGIEKKEKMRNYK